MNQRIICKGLAVAVIILFIGVGIQPAFADVSNTSVSDSIEDCNLCPKVSDKHLFRLRILLNRIEIFNNELNDISKQNPKVEENFQKLLDNISYLQVLNNKSRICEILDKIIIEFYLPFCEIFGGIFEFLSYHGFLIISTIVNIFGITITFIISPFFFLWFILLCWYPFVPPP
jgi:hypothetical protein